MSTNNGSRLRRFGVAKTAALIGAGVLAGGIAVSTIAAGAATTSTTAPSISSSSSTSPNTTAAPNSTDHIPPAGHRQSTPVRGDEKSVTDAQAATLKAAALKAVPGGTVHRIESDAGDGAYEAHLTKADGSMVTVKFDKDLAVTKVEDGMGTGDPAPAGGRQSPPDNGG